MYKRQVQSFANERIEQEKFNKSNEGFLVSKDANYRCMGSFMSGNLFFQGMMYLTTLVFGGWLIAHGKMAVGDLAMYALYIGIFISPIPVSYTHLDVYKRQVYEGMVMEVYKITAWLPAYSTMNTRNISEEILKKDIEDKRKEFVGVVAPPEIREKYIGAIVSDLFVKGNANPIMYLTT